MNEHLLVDPSFSGKLCITLLHSVWQVALFVAVAWSAERCRRGRTVQQHYVVHVAALLGALLAMPVTYALIEVDAKPTSVAVSPSPEARLPEAVVQPEPGPMGDSFPIPSPGSVEAVHVPNDVGRPSPPERLRAEVAGPVADARSTSTWVRFCPWIAALYALGVVLMLARLAMAVARAHWLATRAQVITEGPLVAVLEEMATKWSMSVAPTLAQAEQIVVPQVVGLLHPMILLPASAVTGLSTDELQMILAHELAHIRRYDMWVYFLQRVAETLLFFNPGLWYLSRRISTLREYCCDESACRTIADSGPKTHLRYAAALVRVVELASPEAARQADLAALAAAGRSPSELRCRVARLFGESIDQPLRISRAGLVIMVLVSLAVFFSSPFRQIDRDPETQSAVSASETGIGTADVAITGDFNGTDASDDSIPDTAAAAAAADQEESSQDAANRIEEKEDQPVDLYVVVAKHTLLLNGSEITTWKKLEQKIAALPNPSLAYPHFYITRGAREAGADKVAKDNMWRLHRDFKLRGHSEGSLWPRTDFRYDKIVTKDDLVPDERLRVSGRVVDGDKEAVSGAEVILVTPVDESISYRSYHIALVKGAVRNRLEHVMALSDDQGEFALYPPEDTKHYLIVMHPDVGFQVTRGESFKSGNEISLLPWSGLSAEFDPVSGEVQTASLRTRIEAGDGYPEIIFNQYWSDLKEKEAGPVFRFAHVPQIYRTTINRSFSNKDSGGSVSLPGASVSLLPSEVREVDLGPISEQQAAQLDRIRKDSAARQAELIRSLSKQAEEKSKAKKRDKKKRSGKKGKSRQNDQADTGSSKSDAEVSSVTQASDPLAYATGNGSETARAPPNPAKTRDSQDEPGADEPVTKQETASNARPFQLTVVGPDGVPIPNAVVELRTDPKVTAEQMTRGKLVGQRRYGTAATTDNDGQLAFTLPRKPSRFNVKIQHPGYGPYWAGWNVTDHPESIPSEFTAELDKGWSVGGIVVDGNGVPVKGAEVNPSVYYKKRPGDNSQLGVGTRIITDDQGKWRFDCVPAAKGDVHVAIDHPSYRPLRLSLPRNGFETALGAEPSGRIELSRGLTVAGTVTDDAGNPIEGALLRTKFLNDIRESKTNADGDYVLHGCEPRMTRIVVSAKGRATDMREVRIDPEMEPVNFSMKPGGKIRIRVVDEKGKGIPKARIFFQRWRGMFRYFEFDHVNQYADQNGVWEWNEAPIDEFQADICRPGGMQFSRQPLIARDEEYVFTPARALIASGSVIDTSRYSSCIHGFRDARS